ncbi:hypothetical protein M501DRAFT_1002802 [Patellaria atrata CBS 101060]|uniref:Uncharacterized protein n=1 Tax=Patellaria atrata CBS 101060 TaxID=1346257 RepID=A0A9P4SD71_9PEZI|nr:hypothetical protein M501DRAFT_1002802 [Patellaria atrata CBS 101060]
MELDETSKPFTAELKEDYHHDKAVYQKAVHDILQAHIADVPEGRRRYIEKYIAEILVLSLHNLSNVQRFTIAYVSLNEHEGALRSAICTVTIEFEYKKIDPKTVGVEISRNVYKAILNRKLFEEQEFDQKMLDLGRPIVQAWTIDIATQDV